MEPVSTADSQAWRHRPIISALRRRRQEDQKFKVILGKHRVRVRKGGSAVRGAAKPPDMSLIFRIHLVEEVVLAYCPLT